MKPGEMMSLKITFLLNAVLVTASSFSYPTSTEYYTSAWPYPISVQLQYGAYGPIRFYSNSREYHSCNITTADARVLCKMMGMPYGGASPEPYTAWQYRDNETLSFHCHGDETDIRYCSPYTSYQGGCLVAGLVCYTPVHLVGADGSIAIHSGRLEVRVNGTWGTVCDRGFDYREAELFCRMLGFNGYSHFTNANDSGTIFHNFHPVWMDNLNCMGYEYDIAQCMFNGWGLSSCGHFSDVVLTCVNESAPSTEPYWFTRDKYQSITRDTYQSITRDTYQSNQSTTGTQITKYNWWDHITTKESTRPSTYWWHYTTARYSLENVISSSCTSSGWYIQVDMYILRQIYPDARASDIYLGENSCTGYSNGYTLVFQHGINSCRTSETTTQNVLVYRNKLFYAMRDPQHPFIIRGYNWTVDVECDVMRNETVSGHISHNTQRPFNSVHVQGNSHYNVILRFYGDPNFQYEIPGNPLHVKVGDDVYVKAYTDAADWGIKMSVHSCYTKPDPYAADSMKYYIISNGCEADVNTHYISQSTHETKFMFRDFEYTSNHEGLYLYCDATFCETSDYSDQCQQSCNPRGKRGAESRPKLTETVQEKIIHNHK